MKYFRIWKQLASCAFSSYASNRVDMISYFIGKLVRFCFFLLFIISIFRFTTTLAGYTQYEVLLFFLTYNLVDVLAQAFFRGIYLFRSDINRGNFDYLISKPINTLFYVMTRLTDILDIIFLVPVIVLLVIVTGKLNLMFSIFHIIMYVIMLCIGMIIVAGIHIISAAITIHTVENQNIIWLYRDTIGIGRFPPSIFSPNIQKVFTFIIPVIIIVAFPVKALLGVLSPAWFVGACLVAFVFFAGSLFFWNISLKRYSSASS